MRDCLEDCELKDRVFTCKDQICYCAKGSKWKDAVIVLIDSVCSHRNNCRYPSQVFTNYHLLIDSEQFQSSGAVEFSFSMEPD